MKGRELSLCKETVDQRDQVADRDQRFSAGVRDAGRLGQRPAVAQNIPKDETYVA